MSRTRFVTAVALLLIAACGSAPVSTPLPGAGGRSSNPKTAVVDAYRLVQGQAFRADFSLQLVLKVNGPAAAAMGPLGAGIQASDAVTITFLSPQRNEIKESISDGGAPTTDDVIVYDGKVYHSANDGGTYESFALGPHDATRYGADAIIALLDTVTGATDGGDDTAPDGSIIEDYEATLDPARVAPLLGEYGPKFLGDTQLPPRLRNFFASIHVTASTLQVGIERSGHPVTESLTISSAGDLGTIDPALKGNGFTLTMSGSGTFEDYKGTDITVTPPPGAAPLQGTPPPYV